MKARILAKNGKKVVVLNRRRAIREKCLNCTCWASHAIGMCPFSDCPLYLFRSGLGKQDSKSRREAIREYCVWCTNRQPGMVSKCTSRTCSLFAYRKTRLDWSVNLTAMDENSHIDDFFELNVGWVILWYQCRNNDYSIDSYINNLELPVLFLALLPRTGDSLTKNGWSGAKWIGHCDLHSWGNTYLW